MIFNENGVILYEALSIKATKLENIIWDTSENRYRYKNEKDLPDFIRKNLNKIYQDYYQLYEDLYDFSNMKDFVKECKFFSARFIKWDNGSFTAEICFTNDKYECSEHILTAELDFDKNGKGHVSVYSCDG